MTASANAAASPFAYLAAGHYHAVSQIETKQGAGAGVRLVVADVDGENVVVTIYGEGDNPGGPAMADEFLASVRF